MVSMSKEDRNSDVPKKIELVFEIGLPVNETHFSKIRKNGTFSHNLMLILVNINGNQHRQNRCIL